MNLKRTMFLETLLGILVVAVIIAKAQTPETVDIRTVARSADANETALVWAAVNSNKGSGYSKQGIIDDLPYPQAPGVILVTGQLNGSSKMKVEYLFSGPISGYVTARMVVGGESITLQTFFFDRPANTTPLPQVSTGSMMLHDGLLLQNGVRFDVFNVDGGRVSKLSRFVSSGCCSVSPQVGDIIARQNTVFVYGSFANPAVGIGNSLLMKVSPIPSGLAIQLPYELGEGDWTLTVCDKGLCATRTFYFSPSGSGGGKGGIPGGSATQ